MFRFCGRKKSVFLLVWFMWDLCPCLFFNYESGRSSIWNQNDSFEFFMSNISNLQLNLIHFYVFTDGKFIFFYKCFCKFIYLKYLKPFFRRLSIFYVMWINLETLISKINVKTVTTKSSRLKIKLRKCRGQTTLLLCFLADLALIDCFYLINYFFENVFIWFRVFKKYFTKCHTIKFLISFVIEEFFENILSRNL